MKNVEVVDILLTFTRAHFPLFPDGLQKESKCQYHRHMHVHLGDAENFSTTGICQMELQVKIQSPRSQHKLFFSFTLICIRFSSVWQKV